MKEHELIKEATDRSKIAYIADRENRDEAIDSLKFADGEHWPTAFKAQRIADGRPCLTINKIPEKADQVIGDIRQNRPAIKVVPTGNKASQDVADILNGIIREIEYQSDSESVYDHGGEHAVLSAYGSWRVDLEDDPDDWEDDSLLRINRIENGLSVLWDPYYTKTDRSDAMYCFVFQNMSDSEFERKFPGKVKSIDFAFDGDDEILTGLWKGENSTRIAEYWRKYESKKTLYRYPDGYVTEKALPGSQEGREEKKVKYMAVEWYLISGKEILQGPIQWKGRYFPIVSVDGKEINVNGRRSRRGIVKFAKDPSRAYDYARSSDVERTALAPRAPYLMTPKMVKGHDAAWKNAHKQTFPYLLFNPDPKLAGFPLQNVPGYAPGDFQQAIIASDEIKSTTGIYDASLGARSNEVSGIAIEKRQQEGDVSNFVYSDNVARAIRYTGRILLDLIPKVIDKDALVRVMNEDGTDKIERVNAEYIDENSSERKIFDLSKGKYDARVIVGPSYTTQRQEAANTMLELMKVIPDAAPLIADLAVKNMDIPGNDVISKRLQVLLPEGMLDKEGDSRQLTPADLQRAAQMAVDEFRKSEEGEKLLAQVEKERLQTEREAIRLEIVKEQAKQKEKEEPSTSKPGDLR